MRRGNPSAAAFTVIEALVALAVIVLFACSALVALTQLNRFATAARLRTLALAVAQQRVDEILTVPWQMGSTPATLQPGTRTEANLGLNDDPLATAANGYGSAFSLLDNDNIQAVRTTQITVISSRMVRATVTVAYAFRNRPYQTQVVTLRSTDTF